MGIPDKSTMKAILFVLIGCSFLWACQSHTAEPRTLVDLSVNFVRIDADGKNAFSTASTNPVDPSVIKTSYLKDGKKVDVYDPNLDASRGVLVLDNNGSKYLRMFVYGGEADQEITTTYLQWKENDVDTVKALMTRKPGLLFISKLWFNGNLVYEAGQSGTTWNGASFERLVTIQR